MGNFWEKDKGNKVSVSPYQNELEAMASDVRARGNEYATSLDPFRDELLARPDRAYAENFKSQYQPFEATYLDIARNPMDDALSKYQTQEFERGLSDQQSRYGLIGTPAGTASYAKAMQGFRMGQLANADTRRQGALSTAQTLNNAVMARDLGGRERTLANLTGLDNQALAFKGAAFAPYEALLKNDSARRAQESSQEQSQLAPYQRAIAAAASFYGAGQASYGKGTPTTDGGGGGSVPSYSLSTGGQTAGYGGGQGGYSLYGDTQVNSTPWGAPSSSGYSLYGDSDPGSGGVMSRTGNLRFLGG